MLLGLRVVARPRPRLALKVTVYLPVPMRAPRPADGGALLAKGPSMRINQLAAALAVSLSCVILTASCVESPTEADGTTPSASIDRASERTDVTEPIGE